MTTVSRDYYDLDDGALHYRRRSASGGAGPVLICLHPAPYGSGFFSQFLPCVDGAVDVYAPDLPGFGQSSALNGQLTITRYAQALVPLLESAGQPVALLGYHTGAMVALELAAQNPSLIDRLILPGVPFFDAETRAEKGAMFKPPSDMESLSALEGLWKMAVSGRHEDIPLTRALALFQDAVQSFPNAWQGFRAVFDYGVDEVLPKVMQPALCLSVHGALAEPTRHAGQLLPNAIVQDATDLGPNPFERAPEALAEIINSFLLSEAAGT